MPEYRYTALTRDGREITGAEQADSPVQLSEVLARRQLYLIGTLGDKPFRRSEAAALPQLVGELAKLLDGGIPVEQALAILAEELPDQRIRALCEELRGKLTRGETLSAGMAAVPGGDPLLPALVRIGEESGRLAEVMHHLDRHYEARRGLRTEILSALAYPALLLTVGLASLLGLAFWIVPVFGQLFEDRTLRLPAMTRVLFELSSLLLHYGPALLGIAAIAAAGGYWAWRKYPAVSERWDRWLLAVPGVGRLVADGAYLKVLQALTVSLESALPLDKAMALATGILGNSALRERFAEATLRLRKGDKLPEVMRSLPRFPGLAYRLLIVGNETGALAPACRKASALLDTEYRARLKTLVGMVNPAIILLLGGLIGMVMVAMLIGVLEISNIR